MPAENNDARIANIARIWHSLHYRWMRRRQKPRRNQRPYWDALILTAANRTQARGFELEAALRKETGIIESETQVLVVPDRAGKRIGSGGATLWALKQYAKHALASKPTPRTIEELFAGRRILIMHCGGEGRRAPSSAGAGKLFGTLPFEIVPGRTASAFDAMYVLLCACAEQMDEGLALCAGDVLAVLDPAQLHWRKRGCCGIGIPATPALAAGHGVYVPDAAGRRVAHYLQKPTLEELRAAGGLLDGDRALLDGAGILKFSPDVCARLAALAGVTRRGRALSVESGIIEDRRRRGAGIDVYTDLAWAVTPGIGRERYLAGLASGKRFVREALWDALRGAPFWLDVVPQSTFIHLGNLWQIMQTFESSRKRRRTGAGAAAAIFSAGQVVAAHVSPRVKIDACAYVQNSYLADARGSVGPHSLISECELSGPLAVGEQTLVRGVRTGGALRVADRVALFAVPLTGPDGKRAYCVHGLMDNPKALLSADARFLEASLSDWLARRGIAEKDVWPAASRAERSLWNARLHPVGGEAALALALWMQDPHGAKESAREWRRAERVSFAELFERVDYRRGFEWREALAWRSRLANIRRDLRARRDARELLDAIGAPGEFIELRQNLHQWIAEDGHPLRAARLRAFEAELLTCAGMQSALARKGGALSKPAAALASAGRRRALAEEARTTALRCVAEAVSQGVSATAALDLSAVRRDRVTIDSPARIDFGGGWTDTPPQCLERGGVILSAAIKLNGQYPVRVFAEKIPERAIRLENANARGAELLRGAADLPRFQRLDDPFGLLKAGLSAIGLHADDGLPLESRLEQWGHGLRLVAAANVPKGSGLGTSSILGAAVIAALRRMFGAPLDNETIFRQVLFLEQLLTSGGGWQDQLGALIPGIKLAAVPRDPKFVLRPKVEPLELSAELRRELDRRLVLFYLGKRRVAFNMLREIVIGHLSGNPDVVHALEAIHDIAYDMREALLGGDFDRLGALMTRTRLLYRLMCEGTTSDLIETVFAAAAPYCAGGKCVGAGGGGFIMLMARSAADAKRVRERLKQFSWRGLGEFYAMDIDTRGLHEAK